MSKAEASELLLGKVVEHLLGLLIHDAELGFFGGEFRVEVGGVFGILDARLKRRRYFARLEILPVDFVEEGVAADGPGRTLGHAQPLDGFPVEEETEQIQSVAADPPRHLEYVVTDGGEELVLVAAVERRLAD